MIYVHHHLGLGDHIICNGLIRFLSKQNEIFLFVKPHNYNNVKFMFRDLENLSLISANDDEAVEYIQKNNLQSKYLRIGHENLDLIKYNFDESFYQQVNINFHERWNSFYIKRDDEQEDFLYKKLNPTNEPFVLIHNVGSDGIDRIDYSKVNSKLKMIYLTKSFGIFDYLKLAENATEIHCIDSSFIHLIDSFDFSGKKFFHKNFNSRNFNFSLKNNWIII